MYYVDHGAYRICLEPAFNSVAFYFETYYMSKRNADFFISILVVGVCVHVVGRELIVKVATDISFLVERVEMLKLGYCNLYGLQGSVPFGTGDVLIRSGIGFHFNVIAKLGKTDFDMSVFHFAIWISWLSVYVLTT